MIRQSIAPPSSCSVWPPLYYAFGPFLHSYLPHWSILTYPLALFTYTDQHPLSPASTLHARIPYNQRSHHQISFVCSHSLNLVWIVWITLIVSAPVLFGGCGMRISTLIYKYKSISTLLYITAESCFVTRRIYINPNGQALR